MLEETKHDVRRESGNDAGRLRYTIDYKERLRRFASARALGARVVTLPPFQGSRLAIPGLIFKGIKPYFFFRVVKVFISFEYFFFPIVQPAGDMNGLGQVFEGAETKVHGGHRARFRGVGAMEVSDGISGVSELGGPLPFPFLSRESFPMHQVLEVVSAKA